MESEGGGCVDVDGAHGAILDVDRRRVQRMGPPRSVKGTGRRRPTAPQTPAPTVSFIGASRTVGGAPDLVRGARRDQGPAMADVETAPTAPRDPRRRPTPHAWTISTYFAEGFPYSVVNNLADLFFTEHKATLQQIGLTSMFHLPWNLKFLVGPFVDAYATKRTWLIGLEVLLTLALVFLAVTSTFSTVLAAAAAAFLLLGVLSSIHDIAIDGLYLEALDKDEQARFVGYRAPAYRAAIVVVTGPLVVFAKQAGWTAAFVACAVIMGALLAAHLVMLPRTETPKAPMRALARSVFSVPVLLLGLALVGVVLAGRAFLASTTWQAIKDALAALLPTLAVPVGKLGVAEWIGLSLLLGLVAILVLLPVIRRRLRGNTSFYASAFISLLEAPYATRFLVYIVLFRVGESFLMKMKYPFVSRELGVTLDEYGVVNGVIGMIVGLVAPAIGGWVIAKKGFDRFIWPALLAQNGLHLLFVLLAFFAPTVAGLTGPTHQLIPGVDTRIVIITTTIVVETIGAGLGTAAFMVYIMRCCLPEHKAAHMAILTSIMSVSFTLAGVFSGFLADALGFTAYFAFTFFVTIPHMAMTFFVPHIRAPGAPPQLRA
jgi:PAT family beta-lactamase induction signal transducer AmpG